MPLSGPADPLPHRPQRVLVAGTSGAGKTTLAARIAVVLDAPHVEVDALFHGPAWSPRPSFEDDVHRFSAGPAWVTEWQYDPVRAHLAERADLLVWLDLPRSRVVRQVVRRTHHQTAARVVALLQQRPDLTVVRLRSHDEARRWLQGPLRRPSDARP